MSEDWYLPNDLPYEKKKFCDCVLKVAGKQTEGCLEQKAWRERVDGKICYNPYPVCAKSVGTTSRECGRYYDFNKIPDIELRGYAALNGITIPKPYSRGKMISNIIEWKETKYGISPEEEASVR